MTHSEREYIQLVADILVETYGDTLKEYGTDVKMSEKVVKALLDNLKAMPEWITDKSYNSWKVQRELVYDTWDES
jgi:hypothetical protein